MNIYSVTQVNIYIKSLLAEIPHIQNVYISGEISNYKHYPSGHMYFTLKDAKSQLKCVMFSGDNYKLRFEPKNGIKVVCFGQVGVYERDGVYQLYVRDMQPRGIGDLTIAFEELKNKLEAEGLFDPANKKQIPAYPKKIGVATSNMGAAVEDIKNIITRRYPLCDMIIVPTVVQGDNAAPDIVKSIAFLDEMEDIDLIIVGRGGGSIEDLWAFNTELVARAVFHCKTPVISAVGHETDYTICDFVADLRAPTPSAAAELAVPDIRVLKQNLDDVMLALENAIYAKLEREEQKLHNLTEKSILANGNQYFTNAVDKIDNLYNSLIYTFKNNISQLENNLASYAGKLDALSPLAVLSRGYSIVKKDSITVNTSSALSVGDEVEIIFSNGSVIAGVSEVMIDE